MKVEQKLFVMFLEHRMRTFQGTFHASPERNATEFDGDQEIVRADEKRARAGDGGKQKLTSRSEVTLLRRSDHVVLSSQPSRVGLVSFASAALKEINDDRVA
jgi:hypothetical protein